jgi:hypothetical protein
LLTLTGSSPFTAESLTGDLSGQLTAAIINSPTNT